jgi:hypothetical protein
MEVIQRYAVVAPILEQWLWKPMDYTTGSHCVGLASEVVKALTGRNLVPVGYRKHKTAESCLRAWSTMNKSGKVRQTLDRNFEKVHPLEAQIGDIIEMPSDDGYFALGVCGGAGQVAAFVDTAAGTVCALDSAMHLAVGAWRVSRKGVT